ATDAVLAAAHDRGAVLAAAARSRHASATPVPSRRSRRAARATLQAVLEDEGFEPVEEGPEIRLRNCPFDVLASEHRGLTCSMNRALLEGVLDGVGNAGLDAVSRPADGSCCVRFVPV
ncbi:MAG: hypothetical protein QOF49_629, partial [Chloroflexota bacterium]|nr:hypothetical protein [Chloroflexota bacterium]